MQSDHHPFHPIADVFPLTTDDELADLAHDIAANGLRVPILLHPDGSIVDGRNRYRACLRAHVDPHFETWDGTGSLVDLVLSLNLHRRHLTVGQRALVAARIAQLPVGNPHLIDKNTNDRSIEPIGSITKTAAAKLLGVGHQTVTRGKVVLERGTPTLIDAVERGLVAISAAADVTHLPPAEQDALVAEQAIPRAAEERRAARRAVPGPRRKHRRRVAEEDLRPYTPPPTDRSPAAKEARLVVARELSESGATSEQIAIQLQMNVAACRLMMRKAGIVNQADRAIGRVRKVKPEDVLQRIAWAAENFEDDERLVYFPEIPYDRLDDLVAMITAAMRTAHRGLARLVTRLKQEKERRNGTPQVLPARVENPSGPDRANGGPDSVH
jgi:hypothetical protein